MTKKIIQWIALAGVAVAFAGTSALAQELEGTSKPASEKPETTKPTPKKREREPTVFFRFAGTDNSRWEVNYPRMLFPPEQAKFVRGLKKLATVKETNRGLIVERTETKKDLTYEVSKSLKEIIQIVWPEKDPLLDLAQAELARGNPSGALEIAERFLKFFAPLKAVDGSPWIKGAVIKLDALDQQKNDTVLNSFIAEVEAAPNADKVEGLSQKIKLARLNQLVRKGENAQVLASSNEMIKETSDSEMLARLHLLKGDALYNLARYEEALKTYLQIPVFYGNQATFMPSAKLAIARCLLRMDKPELKSMNLAARSEEYLVEVIKDYPMSPEAKEALKALPKHKRDALANLDAVAEAEKLADVTAKITAEQAEDVAREAAAEEAADAIIAEEEDDPDNI